MPCDERSNNVSNNAMVRGALKQGGERSAHLALVALVLNSVSGKWVTSRH